MGVIFSASKRASEFRTEATFRASSARSEVEAMIVFVYLWLYPDGLWVRFLDLDRDREADEFITRE